MKFLSLERMVGPGRSQAENFEILCLELVKDPGKSPSRAHRNLPPDGGIDIYNPDASGSRIAYQCKAYGKFTGALLAAVEQSARKARETAASTPFDYYVLLIPFVPTLQQRKKLEQALSLAGSRTVVCDGDELETRLFNSPHTIGRFFPGVTVVFAPGSQELTLSTGHSGTVRLYLESVNTEQRVPVSVSTDATVAGLTHFLVTALRLPDTYKVKASSFHEGGDLVWRLARVDESGPCPLPPGDSVASSGLWDGDVLTLTFSTVVEFSGGFMKDLGTHQEQVEVDSKTWTAKEMNPDLVSLSRTGYSEKQGLAALLDDYVEWHLQRLLQ